MKRSALIAGVLLLVVLAVWSGTPTRAQDDQTEATVAALQTQVAVLATRVAQLTTPSPGASASATGVVTETRPVGAIDAVELQTVGTLTIRQGTTEHLTVTAEPAVLPKITTQVQGGRLTIGARGAFSTTQPLRYDLTIKDVRSITDTGSGRIEAGSLHLTRLQLVASGSGGIRLDDLTAPALRATLGGSGDCTLAGSVTQQEVALSGSGSYDAADLSSQTATVVASGAGTATVRVRDQLDVQLGGSGDVAYIGTPRVTQVRTGSGRLRKIG